jgi:predicted metal-dependent phosphotriesterase family hydrolase
MKRRQFLGTMLGTGALVIGCQTFRPKGPFIQTVLGPIPARSFGFALTHEHVMCDFIGAEKTGRHRWDVDEVVRTMRPHLEALRQAGVTGFVDCTPAYIGRDPRVLKRLAEETGLHIVTNTGYYGGANDKFVPKHAYAETEQQLGARWIAEWKHGIEGTDVKPGCMKIGVDEAKNGQLSEIDAKLVRASALASSETNLAVVCHTGGGPAGLAAAKLFAAPKQKFIVAHSDGHGLEINKQVADLGAWVSFDAISRKPLETYLKLVQAMLEEHSGRLLLSHDNGWYAVGEAQKIRPFTYLAQTFLPALKNAGINDAIIRKLTIENPAAAFAI